MASSLLRKNNEDMSFKPNYGPSFFKIILDDPNPAMKLGMPPKFVRTYGDDLSSPIILKVPTGVKWEVEILKSDGQIWLQNGWFRFAEHYSIGYGSFLVFQYEKSDCEFNVIIFHRNSSEIEYPFSFSDGDNLEIVNIHQQFQELNPRRKERSLLSSSPLHKNKNKVENFSEKTGKGTIVRRNKPCLRESSSPQSENPMFRIKMKPSYVQFHKRNKSSLYIPARFARKYTQKKGSDALLNVWDGRSWSIKFCTSTATGFTKILHSGWKKFVRDNCLHAGDVCNFELIDPEKTTFRITISRSRSSSNFEKILKV